MARQVTVEILGNAKQFIAATEQANLASNRLGGGLGKASGTAKTAEADLAKLEGRLVGMSSKASALSAAMTGLSLPLAAAAGGALILGVAGRSMMDISERWEQSQRSLAQATTVQGVNLDQARKFTDTFIQTNKKFIQTQTDVVDGYAALTRSGLKQREVQRDLNIALDLATLSHKPLAEAIELVNKAEHGRMKGLVDLGIVTKDQVDADGNLVGGTKNVAGAMDAVERKTAHGRDTLSDMKQKTNDLGGTWQTFAAKNGPGFTSFLSGALGVADGMANAISNILQKSLDLQNWIGDHTGIGRSPAPTQGQWVNQGRGGARVFVPGTGQLTDRNARAAGGPVLPNSIYTVGEQGPETLVMGNQAGMVIPNRGGAGDLRHLERLMALAVDHLDAIRRKPGLASF